MNKFLGRSLDISVGIGWGNLNGNGYAILLQAFQTVLIPRNQNDLGGKLT